MRVERLEFREQSTENRLQSTAALRCVVFPERDICYQRRATPWTEYSCRVLFSLKGIFATCEGQRPG